MKTSEKKLTVKLFMGFLINSEMRMHLASSIAWKEAQILKEMNPNHLLEVHFQEENYVGKFLPEACIKLSEIKQYEAEVRERLLTYCPTLKQEKFKLYILSQQFIS